MLLIDAVCASVVRMEIHIIIYNEQIKGRRDGVQYKYHSEIYFFFQLGK